jgi:hypothetical protein
MFDKGEDDNQGNIADIRTEEDIFIVLKLDYVVSGTLPEYVCVCMHDAQIYVVYMYVRIRACIHTYTHTHTANMHT